MKELSEYKELTREKALEMTWPIKRCVCRNTHDQPWDTCEVLQIDGLVSGEYPFLTEGFHPDDNFDKWKYCAQIIPRYPRDVPEGLPPLPEDKPFLAYIGQPLTGDLICSVHGFYYFDDDITYKWKPASPLNPIDRAQYQDCYTTYKMAIDVSTAWAQKDFPELVEAMEYEPITMSDESDYGVQKLIGHKLGEAEYDLNWNRTDLLPEDVFGKESSVQKESIPEPPDFEEWFSDFPDKTKLQKEYEKEIFYAGKAYGKWEATQWKYQTLEDYLKALGVYSKLSKEFMEQGFKSAEEQWYAAREVEGGK